MKVKPKVGFQPVTSAKIQIKSSKQLSYEAATGRADQLYQCYSRGVQRSLIILKSSIPRPSCKQLLLKNQTIQRITNKKEQEQQTLTDENRLYMIIYEVQGPFKRLCHHQEIILIT